MGSDIAHFYGKLVFTLRVLKGGGFFKQKKWDLRMAGTFSKFFSFTDEFENNYNDSYPDDLELKKENIETCKTSNLKLSIKVYD